MHITRISDYNKEKIVHSVLAIEDAASLRLILTVLSVIDVVKDKHIIRELDRIIGKFRNSIK